MSFDSMTESAGLFFTAGIRWVCMALAIMILAHQIIALLKMRNPSEIWAYLRCPDGTNVPLTHWENLVGRGHGCDIIINLSSVSRSHATLIRNSEGVWRYNDLNSKNGSYINGHRVYEPTVLKGGDVLTLGGENFELYPVSLQERMDNIAKRKRKTTTTSPWFSMFALTLFQALTVIQFHIALGEDCPTQLLPAFGLLCALMWAYVIIMRLCRRNGFEIEIIAFFLCTLCLAVTTSAYPGTVMKQSICVFIGVLFFFAMCWLLRDLSRAKRLSYIFIGVSVVLLLANLTMGTVVNGSQNWIHIGGFSFQPSEIVKIVFVFIGAATLDELQEKKNLLIFMGFSVFCLGSLAIMGDFGTAIIFFGTFLVISFLRSGDFTKLFLVLGAAGLMGLMVLRFKPYVASRFATWGHVWDDPTGGGYQQVQTMTSIASGGIPGLGAGEGNLSDVAAASTDLVFGLLSEEWGLIIAVLAVLCIITLGVFAYKSIIAGRSTYYSIAACAATTVFLFQTILNVFGSLDLFPLTGVTFPFVSSGGTSMIVSWTLLAFLKAADTRQNASIAIRLERKDEYLDESELSGGEYENPEDFFDDLDNGGRDHQESAAQQEAAQQAAARESEREMAIKMEAARQAAMRRAAAQHEAERQEAARQEAARQEAARQAAIRQAAVQDQAEHQELARQEVARQEAARQAAIERARRTALARVNRDAARNDETQRVEFEQDAAMREASRRAAEERLRSKLNAEDDAFFESFGNSSSLTRNAQKYDEGESPVTLDDLFGDNTGGKR